MKLRSIDKVKMNNPARMDNDKFIWPRNICRRSEVGISSKIKLREPQYSRLAARFTKFRWPSDPPLARSSRRYNPVSEPDQRLWDFKAATKSAQTLRDSIPKMLEFQKTLLWAPETQNGYAAIKALETALTSALPYIEWPFGESKKATGQKRAKEWHTYAHLLARDMIGEMIAAGYPQPGITRNSVVVRVVQKALRRMKIPHSQSLSLTTIGAYLTRQHKKFGLFPPKDISVLTTK
jgi:hypothetical protein